MDPKTEAKPAAPTTADETSTPASLLESLLDATKFGDDRDARSQAQLGIRELVSKLIASPDVAPKIDKDRVTAMMADIDRRLTAQVNEFMHQAQVKQLESSWRGLKYLVDQVNFRENVRLEIVNLSKEDLAADFDDNSDLTKTGLYNTVYRQNFGTLGGEPYGVICSSYEFGAGAVDVQLLSRCAAVAAMAHAPFLGNASPKMFGNNSHTELLRLKDLQQHFEGPQYARWNGFRESEDARYVGLCMPRFMLRAPYGQRESELPVKTFDFSEDVIDDHERYVWGPASIALTAKIADSFAQFRWCPNIVGPQGGGSVYSLPLHQYDQGGELKTKNPCEVPIDDRRELELAEQGFIGMVFRKGSDNAAFISANSTQRPKLFPKTDEGFKAQTNYMLGTRLPYMFIVTRLAHYLKVLQREQIGTTKNKADLTKDLNDWIKQYVSDQPNPPPSTRARKPLRKAKITVEDVEGQVGWFKCDLQVEPHIKFEGVDFTLSLVGKLDKT